MNQYQMLYSYEPQMVQNRSKLLKYDMQTAIEDQSFTD